LWIQKYYAWVPELIEEGGIYPEEGRRVAKGLKYALKALDDSSSRYRSEKRKSAKDGVAATDRYFDKP
jgi:hypothetical protein